jgi:DNA invertase Pin-like site-specific DNA recombinase
MALSALSTWFQSFGLGGGTPTVPPPVYGANYLATRPDAAAADPLALSANAILYSRVSTPDQDMSAQLFRLRKYAADENLRVTQEVLDRGSAWASPQLLQLEGVLEAARDINLVVHDETRFSRNAVHGAQLIRTCMRNRIAVHVVGIDDPYICTGRANWGRLRAGVDNAETESDIRSARASAFQRNRRAQRIAGGWVPAPRRRSRRQPPFGCCYIGVGLELQSDTNERESLVLEIIRRLICGTEMAPFYELFNRVAPSAGTPGALGGERERLLDDYGREYTEIGEGHIGPKYIYSLLNIWEIRARRGRRWTRRALEEAILHHLGSDVLTIAHTAEEYSEDAMDACSEPAEAEPDCMNA